MSDDTPMPTEFPPTATTAAPGSAVGTQFDDFEACQIAYKLLVAALNDYLQRDRHVLGCRRYEERDLTLRTVLQLRETMDTHCCGLSLRDRRSVAERVAHSRPAGELGLSRVTLRDALDLAGPWGVAPDRVERLVPTLKFWYANRHHFQGLQHRWNIGCAVAPLLGRRRYGKMVIANLAAAGGCSTCWLRDSVKLFRDHPRFDQLERLGVSFARWRLVRGIEPAGQLVMLRAAKQDGWSQRRLGREMREIIATSGSSVMRARLRRNAAREAGMSPAPRSDGDNGHGQLRRG